MEKLLAEQKAKTGPRSEKGHIHQVNKEAQIVSHVDAKTAIAIAETK
jgi:hypothetical protein